MSKDDTKSGLPAAMRKALIRETFEAIAAVGLTKWKAEEIMGWGYEPGEEDRQHYFRQFEKDHFAEFEKMAESASDDRLLDLRADWIEKANSMGLTEWQEILLEGRGGEPFTEAVEQEVAQNQSTRRPGREQSESTERASPARSVLGYDLPEPSTTPTPDKSRGR